MGANILRLSPQSQHMPEIITLWRTALDGQIPAAEAAEVLAKTQAHLAKEAKIREQNKTGTSDPERFDAVLRAKGLPV